MPRTLPLTELAVLITPDMGVCGGVVHGKPVNEALDAATLGTFPRVGVGLLVITAAELCSWDDGVMADDDEFDLVGLGRFATGRGENEDATAEMGCFSKGVADTVVGVGVGVGWAEEAAEIAGDG